MPLTDDEYSCLMIMAQGQNLIRMKDTRWYAPLTSLHEHGYTRNIGNENYVINASGTAALAEHEKSLDGDLGRLIESHGKINNARHHMQSCMNDAANALVAAARAGAAATGESPQGALIKIMPEVEAAVKRALA